MSGRWMTYPATRAVLVALMLGLAARPASAQSLIFPGVLDRHYVHLATKPVVSLGVYAGLRAVHLAPTPSTVLAIVGPALVSDVVWEFKLPGHFTDGVTITDSIQDTFAASLGLILLRMRGWQRVAAVALWGTVEFGFGLHKLARP